MLGLNLSQWNDLTVVDHERLHDLLAQHRLASGDDIGLDMARRLAREAGVWTVVLGDFTPGRRLAPPRRAGLRRGQRQAGWTWPGWTIAPAPTCGRCSTSSPPSCSISPARRTRCGSAWPAPPPRRSRPTAPTSRGVEQLNRWDLAGAERDLQRAIALDTTFGLAYYKLALTRGWLVGTGDSIADDAIVRATAYSANLPPHDRTVINAYRAFLGGEYAEARAAVPAAPRPRPGRRRRLVRPGRGLVPRHRRRRTRRRTGPRRSARSSARWRSIPTTRWPTSTCSPC